MRQIALFLALCSFLAGPSALAADTQQTTTGACSPAIIGNNNQIVCSGIPPEALAFAIEQVKQRDLTIAQQLEVINDWARKYRELDKQLTEARSQAAAQGEDASLIKIAQDLLHEGKLEEAGVARSQIHAVQLIEEHHPQQALDVLRDAEQRLKWKETSAPHHLLQGYLYKTYAQAYSELGDSARANQYLERALNVFKQVQDSPELEGKTTLEYAGAINGIGNIHYERHQYRDAIANFDIATKLVPGYAYAWHDMFLAYVALAREGDIDLVGMRKAFDRTKETGPGWPGLDSEVIAGLETILRGFEQSSKP